MVRHTWERFASMSAQGSDVDKIPLRPPTRKNDKKHKGCNEN